jgi:DNA-binding NarL/FixJ family response regulator
MTNPVRVAIVDDQHLVRTGFRMIIDAEDDMVVVGEAADGRAAVAVARAEKPDVILMDVRMPTMDGIEATRQILREEIPTETRILILTTFDIDEHVYDALRAGASGFLLKDVPPEDLVRAIRVVADGEALLAPSVTRRLIAEFAARPSSPHRGDAVSELTPREAEVLEHVARGLSNAEIAAGLHVEETTVKTHVSRILSKLGLRDRVQAVVFAYESGLVQPGGTPSH